MANDTDPVRFASAAFSGSSFNFGSPDCLAANVNSPYATTDFNTDTGVSARVVAAGLRCRYGGTELNRGGFKIALVDPTHDPINGRTLPEMNAEQQTQRLPVSRQWSALLYRPVRSTELDFVSADPSATPYMGFMLISPDPTIALVFEWEYFVIVEYQGTNARGQTHTCSDPTGYAAVSNVANQMNGIVPVHTPSFASRMLATVGQHLTTAVSGASQVLTGGLLNSAGKLDFGRIASLAMEAAPLLMA
jgi:hypothetical protein